MCAWPLRSHPTAFASKDSKPGLGTSVRITHCRLFCPLPLAPAIPPLFLASRLRLAPSPLVYFPQTRLPFPLVLPLTFFISLFLLCALVSISLLVYPTPLNDNFRSLAVKPVSGTPSDAETLFYA